MRGRESGTKSAQPAAGLRRAEAHGRRWAAGMPARGGVSVAWPRCAARRGADGGRAVAGWGWRWRPFTKAKEDDKGR